MVLPDLGLRSLAAADPKEGSTLAHGLLRQTKLGSTSTAPRDRTPSRFCSRLQWSSLTWRAAVPRSRGSQRRPNFGPGLAQGKQSLDRPARRRGTGRPPGFAQGSNGPPVAADVISGIFLRLIATYFSLC